MNLSYCLNICVCYEAKVHGHTDMHDLWENQGGSASLNLASHTGHRPISPRSSFLEMLVTRGHTPKGLKTTDTDCLAALGAESPKLRCGQGWAPSEPSRAGARLPAREAAAAFVFPGLRFIAFSLPSPAQGVLPRSVSLRASYRDTDHTLTVASLSLCLHQHKVFSLGLSP